MACQPTKVATFGLLAAATLAGTLAMFSHGAPAAQQRDCSAHSLAGQVRSADFIRRLDRAWGHAWDTGDIAFLDCLYDRDWHYLTSDGIATKSQDLAAAMRHHARHPTGTQRQTHVLELRAYLIGNWGVAAGLYEVAANGQQSRGRWSDSFQWNGTAWHAVFSQATPIQSADVAAAGAEIFHDRWPAVSPDGASVAFQRAAHGAMDIYVVGIDGSNLRRLTHMAPAMLAVSPAWLPDGKHLLFVTTDANATYPSGHLMEIGTDGGQPTVVGPPTERAHSVSADGRRLIFANETHGVSILTLASGAESVIARPAGAGWDLEPAWSPDDAQVAFGCHYRQTPVERADLCVMKADGSNMRTVSQSLGVDEWPAWSPDGTRVAFQRDTDAYAKGAIVVMNVASGHEDVISAKTGYAINETPAWAPDGRLVLQVRTPNGYRIAVMNPDGSDFRLITEAFGDTGAKGGSDK